MGDITLLRFSMQYGDIEGKNKIYDDSGEPIITRGERKIKCLEGMLYRGWVRYKLGWRTIMFKGYGTFYFTNDRIIYIEVPEYIQKIHTFSIDHELGDFGGWDYHAHRLRRAVRLGAYLFFELPLNEITKFKHKKEQTLIFAADKKDKYKIIVDHIIGKEIEQLKI
jgi:hypothetical protein